MAMGLETEVHASMAAVEPAVALEATRGQLTLTL